MIGIQVPIKMMSVVDLTAPAPPTPFFLRSLSFILFIYNYSFV